MAHWKPSDGPAKGVIFLKVHSPGVQSLSDFTHMDRSCITIRGVVLRKCFIKAFRLVYSKWSYVEGHPKRRKLSESAVAGTARGAFFPGGSTQEHRMDSLSAAFKNLSAEAKEDVTGGNMKPPVLTMG